jgi:hypothetical protein
MIPSKLLLLLPVAIFSAGLAFHHIWRRLQNARTAESTFVSMILHQYMAKVRSRREPTPVHPPRLGDESDPANGRETESFTTRISIWAATQIGIFNLDLALWVDWEWASSIVEERSVAATLIFSFKLPDFCH